MSKFSNKKGILNAREVQLSSNYLLIKTHKSSKDNLKTSGKEKDVLIGDLMQGFMGMGG